jgi:hypothetical protein
VVAIDFSIQLTYEWSATISLVCESAAALTLTRSRIAKWYRIANRYPNVFRTARFYSGCWIPHRVPFAFMVMQQAFSIIEQVRYYHCPSMWRTYGANMPQGNPVSRYQLVYAGWYVAPPTLLIGGNYTGEATITLS